MQKAIDNEMRVYILNELSKNKDIPFSKLFKKRFYSSSQFTYHLNWLIKKNYVSKKEGLYSLNIEGKKLVNNLSINKIVEQPLIVTAVLLKKGKKILTSCSKKEPLRELYGLSCFGKFNDPKKIVKKHTNLELGKYEFGGIFNIKTEDIGIYHQLIVFISKDFTGKLIDSENRLSKWVTRKQLSKLKQFPENEFILNNLDKNFYSIERNIENNTFKVLLK